jgi:hypothetical protein
MRRRDKPVIWVKREAKYFCKGDWTTQISETVMPNAWMKKGR